MDTFKIEVDIFTSHEIRDQIGRLLHVYRHYYESQRSVNPVTSEESVTYKDFQVAEYTLHDLFGVSRATKSFLCEGALETVRSRLFQWLEESFPSEQETGTQILRELTLDGCREELKKLSTVPSSASAVSRGKLKWSYIRCIKSVSLPRLVFRDPLILPSRVYLKAQILSTGLILLDLPGTRLSGQLLVSS